jgi:energy-converting hydrogenase B subunit Q
MTQKFGFTVRADSGPGVLHQLTGVIARHQGDISSVEIIGERGGEARLYFEIELPEAPDALLTELPCRSCARLIS